MLRFKWVVVIIALVIVCHLAILGLGFSGSTNDAFWGLILGAIFGQIALLAVWTAWGPSRLHWRVSTGLFGTLLLCASFLYSTSRRRNLGEDEFMFASVFFAQWFAMQIPLWFTRIGFRWRLAWPNEVSLDHPRRELQFGIRQLFGWTAMVAILMGICRVVLPALEVDRMHRIDARTMIAFVILLSANSLLAVPVVWAAFARTRLILWWATAGACAVVLTTAEIVTYYFYVFRADDVIVIAFVNLIQFVAASVSLLLLRASGFRVIQSVQIGCLQGFPSWR
jgi:hypothetical protein